MTKSHPAMTPSSTEYKLNVLENYLAEKRASSKETGGGIVCDFVRELFLRCSEDYIHLRTVKDLAKVGSVCHDFYTAFVSQPSPFAVCVSNTNFESESEPQTVIMTTVDDRAFVVDTVTELLKNKGYSLRVLLHPIVACNQQRHVSVVFIELDHPLGEEDRLELQTQLTKNLADLVLATEDFTKMYEQAIRTADLIEHLDSVGSKTSLDGKEIADFLRWLVDGGFLFMGYREWTIDPKHPNIGQSSNLSSEDLGIFRTQNKDVRDHLNDIAQDIYHHIAQPELLHFSTIPLKSPIRRKARVQLVMLKHQEKDSKKWNVKCFVGLLTAHSMEIECSSIPIIRRKLVEIMQLEGSLPHSYDHNVIGGAINSMPKSELFWFPTDTILKNISLLLKMQQQRRTKIVLQNDPLCRFTMVMVVLPRDRYSENVRAGVQKHLEEILDADPSDTEYKLAISDEQLARIHFVFSNPSKKPISEQSVDQVELEREIAEITITWEDSLRTALSQKYDTASTVRLGKFYCSALPSSYKAANSINSALSDIEKLESLTPDRQIAFRFSKQEEEEEENTFMLKVYKLSGGLTLSSIVPTIENTGFIVINERTTELAREFGHWATIYRFNIIPRSGNTLNEALAREHLIPGYQMLLDDKADNDILNQLLIEPGMSMRQVAILRTIKQYLVQIKIGNSGLWIMRALVNNPDCASLAVQFFEAKFSPDNFENNTTAREEELDRIRERYTAQLKNVTRLIEDRVLRSVINTIEATVRTNYFLDPQGLRIALKIDCSKIAKMPDPRPLFEIFVCSPEIEGIHLRAGKVARGGLRWSERPEDFRTEVLGLMKTQVVKNSIIVPSGAKGGFIVKHRPENPAELAAAVEDRYRKFIRSLLEVTDSLAADGTVVKPPRCICYDDVDPYLVVAADKGTAIFSDVANEIASKEFNFWLGDAFASGGSNGYDHKKLSITAGGAWEAVQRHFRELNIDLAAETITVVGLGDMSGDVFGNGLLCSDRFKLIAAFNHKHIFLDPTPDPQKSFEERKRLFALPKSNWTDYDHSLISQGGGVYDRLQKEIDISPEVKKALDISEDVISGEELIKAILRAPVDLLWNGGIGTYIKASTEDNVSVGDRANDDVRVDASEVRAKVLAEGGNLGITQKARVELALSGAHLNTDFIDNSGGVDLSDLEVNLKILLKQIQEKSSLTLQERNTLLSNMAQACCERVLSRNRSQTLAISLDAQRSRRSIERFERFIIHLESTGALKRESEVLPDHETLELRKKSHIGLVRPELALLLSYAKLDVFNILLTCDLSKEPFFTPFLMGYFDEEIRKRFDAEIKAHRLRPEIIAAQVANTLVETMGATYVNRISEETGASTVEVIHAFVCAYEILGARKLLRELLVLDTASNSSTHIKSLFAVTTAIESMSRWLLVYKHENVSWSDIVNRFSKPFAGLFAVTPSLLADGELEYFNNMTHKLALNDVPESLCGPLASMSFVTSFMDTVEIGLNHEVETTAVASLYTNLSSHLRLTALMEKANSIVPSDNWELLALGQIVSQLRNCVRNLTLCVIQEAGDPSKESLDRFLESRREEFRRYLSLVESFADGPVPLSALFVATSNLEQISRPQ